MKIKDLKDFLDEKYLQYNNPAFITDDPISVPHQFTRKEDIEIAGILSASIAWGQRPTIIRNANRLIQIMDHEPYEFILSSSGSDLEKLDGFCHRTFNSTDARFFIKSLTNIYKNHGGLEEVFTRGYQVNESTSSALIYFRKIFFEIDHPERTKKHVANIAKGSSAKRLNMFLRWMIRKDRQGVDFGIWDNIPSSALMLPLDIHTGQVARKLNLLIRKQNDWRAVEEVTRHLQDFDPQDPVKYDYALFGLGIYEKF